MDTLHTWIGEFVAVAGVLLLWWQVTKENRRSEMERLRHEAAESEKLAVWRKGVEGAIESKSDRAYVDERVAASSVLFGSIQSDLAAMGRQATDHEKRVGERFDSHERRFNDRVDKMESRLDASLREAIAASRNGGSAWWRRR